MSSIDKYKVALQKGYNINKNTGEVYSIRNKTLSLFSFGRRLYKQFSVRVDGKTKSLFVHKFVAYIKFGEKAFEKGIHVRHLNSDSLDNSWDNIGIGTPQDNSLDKPAAERLMQAKYAASFNIKHDKVAIKDYYNYCKSYPNTMEKFKISSKGTLWYILNK